MKMDANTPEEYIAEFDRTYAIEYCMITLEIALRFEEKSCDKDEVCGLLSKIKELAERLEVVVWLENDSI